MFEEPTRSRRAPTSVAARTIACSHRGPKRARASPGPRTRAVIEHLGTNARDCARVQTRFRLRPRAMRSGLGAPVICRKLARHMCVGAAQAVDLRCSGRVVIAGFDPTRAGVCLIAPRAAPAKCSGSASSASTAKRSPSAGVTQQALDRQHRRDWRRHRPAPSDSRRRPAKLFRGYRRRRCAARPRQRPAPHHPCAAQPASQSRCAQAPVRQPPQSAARTRRVPIMR